MALDTFLRRFALATVIPTVAWLFWFAVLRPLWVSLPALAVDVGFATGIAHIEWSANRILAWSLLGAVAVWVAIFITLAYVLAAAYSESLSGASLSLFANPS
jgi:hypothetical protein